MRFVCCTIIALLPLLLPAQKQPAATPVPQESIYFSKPEALQTAGVKWVTDVYRDSRGLTWFATDNGLFRFDGTNILYTKHTVDDSLTLPYNEVRSVTEDKEGNMWVGTVKGAVMMDANTLACTLLKQDNGYSPGYKFNFFTDEQDNVWAATDAGLYKGDRQKKIIHLVWNGKPQDNDDKRAVTSVASYSKDELVCGSLGDVVLINKHNFSYRRFPLGTGNSPIDVTVTYVDAQKNIWIGTWGSGIFYFDKAAQAFKPFEWQANIPVNARSIVRSVLKVFVNGRYFLYIGTTDGLIKAPLMQDGVTPVQNSQQIFMHTPDTESSIPAGEINSLVPDENNNLWIGSSGDVGIARIALNESPLHTLPINHGGTIREISNLNIDGKKYYSVSSWHGEKNGLTLLDENLDVVKTFDRLPYDADHDGANVSSVGTDSLGRLWISSWKGITVMDKNFRVVKVFDHRTKGRDTLYREKNNALLISNDTVWVAIYKRGIDLFTTGFKRLKHYNGNENGLHEDLVWRFFRAKNGKIWLLGNAFLYEYDAAKDKFIAHYFSKDSAAFGPVDITEKKDGSLLIASATGLIHFNPATGQSSYIRSPLLDKEDFVNSVTVDDSDNAWFLTDEHLVHYNFGTNIFTLYGRQDGFDIQDGMYQLKYVGNNKLLIGQNSKLVVFTPPQSAKKYRVPGLLVTGVYVNDSLVNASLPKALSLHYNQNKINIAFACVNYSRPEQNIFAYRLKNADTAWTYTRVGNVTYANLSPGHYVFEVKAANYARVWSKINSFQINISPPFWQSWWFRLLLFGLAATGTYIVFKWRVGNIRKEEKIKTDLNRKMAELEMKALRAQMNPHFVFNSLSSIQESIVTGKTDAASKYLSKFSKLIRLILENSGKQFISLKTEIDSLTLYLELESFRFENFTYTFSIDPQIDANFTMIPSMVIQPFIENALKHGLSKKKNDKHLKIDIRMEHGRLAAIVEDNGVGRAIAAQVKTLERKDHHSMGIKITEERLQLLGEQNGAAAQITDLFDREGNAAGTLVKIILPVEN